MNKRQGKKNLKKYHRRFCHVDQMYAAGYSKIKYEDYQCPKCGWDSLDADKNIEMGTILWQTGGFYDKEFEVEYKCPCCGSVFSYVDGV